MARRGWNPASASRRIGSLLIREGASTAASAGPTTTAVRSRISRPGRGPRIGRCARELAQPRESQPDERNTDEGADRRVGDQPAAEMETREDADDECQGDGGSD